MTRTSRPRDPEHSARCPSPEPERRIGRPAPVDDGATRRTSPPATSAPASRCASGTGPPPARLAEDGRLRPRRFRPVTPAALPPTASDANRVKVEHTMPHSLVGFAGPVPTPPPISLDRARRRYITYLRLPAPAALPEHYLTARWPTNSRSDPINLRRFRLAPGVHGRAA